MNIIRFEDGIYNLDSDTFTPIENEPELEIAKKLLIMLSRKRAENKEEWETIGSIMFNIGKSSYKALGYWIEFTKRSNKFTELDCIKQWSNITTTIDNFKWLKLLHDLVEKDVNKLTYEEFLKEYDSIKDIEIKDEPQVIQKEIRTELEKNPEPVKLTYPEIFDLFINECISNKEGKTLNLTDFSDVFIPWFQENFLEEKIPTNYVIKSFFYNHPNSGNNMMWRGYSLKNEAQVHQARVSRIKKQI